MFGSSVPNGILTNFSGPLITAMGFSQLNAALLDCAGRSLQISASCVAPTSALLRQRLSLTKVLLPSS